MRDAQATHEQAFVIDAHSDILIPVADGLCRLGRRTSLPRPDEWRELPGSRAPDRPTPYQLSNYANWFGCAGQYDVPAFKEGGVTAQVTAIYISDAYLNRPVERALSLISALHQEIAANPDDLLLARTPADIYRAKDENKTALLLAFEGAEPLGHDLSLLDAYYVLGLRMVGLTHSRRNIWGDGSQVDTQTGGLTKRGRQLVKRLNKLGILVDLAHLNDVGFWEILEMSDAPPILSHSSVTRSYAGYRAPLIKVNAAAGTSKLRALAERGGVAGILFWGQPDVEAIVDDIAAALDHVGGDDHVGLGSDLFSLDGAPEGLETIAGLRRLTDAMFVRGYEERTINKILGRNWLRVFREVIDR